MGGFDSEQLQHVLESMQKCWCCCVNELLPGKMICADCHEYFVNTHTPDLELAATLAVWNPEWRTDYAQAISRAGLTVLQVEELNDCRLTKAVQGAPAFLKGLEKKQLAKKQAHRDVSGEKGKIINLPVRKDET